jgi:hypothetical protein
MPANQLRTTNAVNASQGLPEAEQLAAGKLLDTLAATVARSASNQASILVHTAVGGETHTWGWH